MNELPRLPGEAPVRLLRTTDETAAFLGMSPGWVRGAAKRGEIPIIRCGRSIRFDMRDIEAHIRAHKTIAAPPSDNIEEEGRG